MLCPRRHVQAWRWVPSYLVEPVSLAWFLDVNALALSCFFFPLFSLAPGVFSYSFLDFCSLFLICFSVFLFPTACTGAGLHKCN
ncbi:hypothetical protein J3E68DRAFT_409102 [Trichoderma sp. SZMC 28012]